MKRVLHIAAAGLAVAATIIGVSNTSAQSSRPALSPLQPGRQPPPSLFGINTGTYDSSESRLSRDLPTAVSLGARWVHFTGDSIKYSGGRVSFAVMDS